MNERSSVIQCVSTAFDMLQFSTDAIYNNAGTDNFDVVFVTWCASEDVREYLHNLARSKGNVTILQHETDESIGYIPNLRKMMNRGIEYGFYLNQYCCLVNLDMYFGPLWLRELQWNANEDVMVNSFHISPITGKNIHTANLGLPIRGAFNYDAFYEIYTNHWARLRGMLEVEGAKDWEALHTMPYLLHKKWWQECGPWELEMNMAKGETEACDHRFFRRCHNAGMKMSMAHGSIVYHHEGVERRRARPSGTEHLVEETNP